MSSTTAKVRRQGSRPGGGGSPHLDRLVDFVEPVPSDECLDLTCGGGPLPAALEPLVRHVTAVDATKPAAPGGGTRTPTVVFGLPQHGDPGPVRASACALPYRDATFSLVTCRFSLRPLGDTGQAIREMARVCRPGGRLIIAEAIRPPNNGAAFDRLERLRAPALPPAPTLDALIKLLTEAGTHVRRLDRLSVERPAEPWLEAVPDPGTADLIHQALLNEVDGGPRTGARPRVIGGELWVTQTWAHLAAER